MANLASTAADAIRLNGGTPARKNDVSTAPLESLAPGSLEAGVLITIHRLSYGGADRVTMLLANGFVAAGIPTAILVLRTAGEGELILLDMLDPAVVVIHAGLPMGSRHLELLRGVRFIRRQVALARPAVVLASSSNMGLVTGVCARLIGHERPRFLMKLTNPVIRPADSGIVKRRYRRALYRFIFSSYDQILILTNKERSGLTRLFPSLGRRFLTVSNPYVTPAMLEGAARERGNGPAQLITVARLMPQKRLDRLLTAFARSKTSSVKLLILGEGPERPRLEALAATLGVTDRVEMPGHVLDVEQRLRQADLFVLSSDYEGLPAAVLEALACNVPVITTDCFDAARELLDDAPRCAVVPRDDVDGFAAAIDRSLATSGPHDLSHIARPYTFEVAIAAHLAVVRTCIDTRAATH